MSSSDNRNTPAYAGNQAWSQTHGDVTITVLQDMHTGVQVGLILVWSFGTWHILTYLP